MIHHHTRNSCAKTWRFAYGISEITHKRATGRQKNSKKKKQQQKVPKKHFRPVSEADQTKTARNAWHSLHIRTIKDIPRLNSRIKLPANTEKYQLWMIVTDL